MAKARLIGDEKPSGTKYILWYQGYCQCFRTLASAHRAQKALSWVEYQDSQITDKDGNDPDGLDMFLAPSREEVLADFLASMAPVENDPVAGGAVIDTFTAEYPAEMAWAFGEVE